jgi:hypothetical protein
MRAQRCTREWRMVRTIRGSDERVTARMEEWRCTRTGTRRRGGGGEEEQEEDESECLFT